MRRLIVFAVIIAFLGSCNLNKREHAMKLSGDLIAINDSLDYFGKAWGDEFTIAVNTRDFSRLSQLRQNLRSYIDKKTIHVKTMKDVGKSQQLRESVLNILQFESDSVLPRFIVFESFDSTTNDQQIKDAFANMMQTAQTDAQKRDVMFRLLDEYAEKNDFPKPVNK